MMVQRETQSIVFVVDDDASLRDALSNLLRSVGLRVEAFGSAAEFLKGRLPDAVSCLVLDIRLPGVGGLDFQATRQSRHSHSDHFHHRSRRHPDDRARSHSLFVPCSVTNFPLVPRRNIP
jgi:CheY-like chemotaxis protein